ncbi:MAG: 3',5'-cyclic-AMP phosphodiesterase [Pseudomonadota bacterium]
MATQIKPKSSKSIKIVQITDTHILDDGAPLFNGLETSESLEKILKRIKLEERDLDLVLLTGDLVQNATNTSYEKLITHLSLFTVPVFSLPGNHDNPAMLNDVFKKEGHDVEKIIHIGEWCIIMLNSCVIGSHSGELSESELKFLQMTLGKNIDKHCLIALHHHPVSIDSSWMDSMILINAESFLSVVDEYQHVRAIIWGHIHQKFESQRKKISLYGTPSTCMQFKPKATAFAIDDKPPGFRRLMLNKDGSINTEVVYLSE